MHPVPQMPQVLDPDRMLRDTRADMTAEEHQTQAQRLEQALHESCEYAQELWQHVAAARQYLYDSLPSDPRAPGTAPHACASPTGPDDDAGWQQWTDTYATVTSILAGPHGDSGFGQREAQLTARARREAPNLRVLGLAGQPSGDAQRPSEVAAERAQPAAERPGSTLLPVAVVGVLGLLVGHWTSRTQRHTAL